MKVAFTVISCKANKNGGFVWKLSANQTATAFGITKTIKRTYYIGNMPSVATIGAVLEEDITRFDVVERPCYQKADGDDWINVEEGEEYDRILMLKWLHVKAA